MRRGGKTFRRCSHLSRRAWVLAACSGRSSPGSGTKWKACPPGGTRNDRSFTGDQFNYILPLLSYDYATGANIEDSEYLMWRPLYWFGGPGSAGLDGALYAWRSRPGSPRVAGRPLATSQLKK